MTYKVERFYAFRAELEEHINSQVALGMKLISMVADPDHQDGWILLWLIE